METIKEKPKHKKEKYQDYKKEAKYSPKKERKMSAHKGEYK